MAKRIDLADLYRTDPHNACRLAMRRARRACTGYRGGFVVDGMLDSVSESIGGYGAAAIRGDGWVTYFLDIAALYVNTGDSYACTVLYDVRTSRYLVTSCGDWIECEERNGRGAA